MTRFPHPGRRRRAAAALAVLVLLPGAVAACSSSDGPDKTVGAFLAGWPSGNLDEVGFVGTDGATFPAQQVVEQIKSLSGDLGKTPPTLKAQDEPKINGELATGTIAV